MVRSVVSDCRFRRSLSNKIRHVELHKNAFWIYGVVVGLVIREPLSCVVPDLIQRGMTGRFVQLEVWRTALFPVLIVRFY